MNILAQYTGGSEETPGDTLEAKSAAQAGGANNVQNAPTYTLAPHNPTSDYILLGVGVAILAGLIAISRKL